MRGLRRRGSQAVELALLLPMLLTLVAGAVDVGVYLHRTEALVGAAADGARVGAADGDESISVAEEAAQAAWDAARVPGTPTFTASLSGDRPNQRVVMSASVPYEPYFGLVPVPRTLAYRCAFRLDQQPEL